MPTDRPCYQCEKRHRACWDSCPEYQAMLAEQKKKKEFLDSDKEVREYNLKRWIRRQAFCRAHKIRKFAGSKEE